MSGANIHKLGSIRQRGWLWLFHIIFWILQLAILSFVYQNFVGQWDRAVIVSLINITGHLILVYITLGVLIPRFYQQKRRGLFVILLLLLLLATSAFRYFFGWQMALYLGWGTDFFYEPSVIGGMFFGGIWILVLAIPLALIGHYYRRQELEQDLKTQQLEAELRFLKAQVNPHFLFNALNNIYSLSFTNSSKAPEMILKLSDMMSYMLYDCKEELVLLQSEIDYLQNFIDLQQLKKDGELNVDFEIEGDTAGAQIVPMLFIPFFENAFKHGNLDDIDKGWLKAKFIIQPAKNIRLIIENSVDPNRKLLKKGGVGLENIRDRLKLLFPENHQLMIDAQENRFTVDVKIDL